MLTERQSMVRQMARKFAQRELAPHRDVRVCSIYGGSPEIQRLVIARRLAQGTVYQRIGDRS